MGFKTQIERYTGSAARLTGALAHWVILGLIAAPSAGMGQNLSLSNVRAAQRAGTNLVDIYYDLSGGTPPITVSVAVSSNGGSTYTVPALSLTGHVDANVPTGNRRKITWNAGADWADQFSEGMKVKLSATDASQAPEGMVLIPAGEFQMGDFFNEQEYPDELPVHTVFVSAFYMEKMEVTKALWDSVANWAAGNGYDINAASASAEGSNHPVHSVSWCKAVKWCNARSQKEGLTPCYTVGGNVYKTGDELPLCNFSANGYRLPTEAEWEKAARGGLSGKRFPWGDTISHSQANYYGDPSGWYPYDQSSGFNPAYDDGTEPYTAPVGSFQANGYGLFDMAGNVGEFCYDVWSEDYYQNSPAADPTGPDVTGLPPAFYWRIYRGGGWSAYGVDCRVSIRYQRLPSNEVLNRVGFRAVRR